MTTITIKVPKWLDKILAWPVLIYRRWRYGYSYRRIPVGEGYFAIVDPGDYYWLNRFHWMLRRNNNSIYAFRFFDEPGKKTKIISMHRDIMKPRKGLLVDHRNRNALDNRRENLRIATRCQNMQNRSKIKKATTSRFIGVHKEKRTGHWVANIDYRGKTIYLGTYINEVDAAKAYDKAAKKYRREFANLNFP
ncbi:MAG: HNH endonuclease [Sedimentisphaerales bacterium]